MKVLLPIDGSRFTNQALDYAATTFGNEHQYVLLTVVPAISVFAASFLDADTVNSYYQDEAQKVLRPALYYIHDKLPGLVQSTDSVHLHGHAADKIAQYATSEMFDLIIMGTHGHAALKNVVLGSVATGVLARCKVPVLLIR